LFGVAIRALALWFFTDAFYWGYVAFWKNTTVTATNVTLAMDVREGVERLIVGVVLMIFADHIVKVVYGPQIGVTPRDAGAASSPSTDD
jgi:hypothetical protein